MADPTVKEEEKRSTPADYFKTLTHDLVTHDASFQLLQPGKNIRDILAKTTIDDEAYAYRVAQTLSKLEESDIGEGAEKEYLAGVNLVANILILRNTIRGRSRIEFIQALSRVVAPSIQELLNTGKITSEGGKPQKKYGILKSREQKREEQE